MSKPHRAETFRILRLQGVTLEEIGRVYGITRERVRQLIADYEQRYHLPPSAKRSVEIRAAARIADKRDARREQRRQKQLDSPRFVETVQLDADLVGRFLMQLGENAVYFTYRGGTRLRKDGLYFPSHGIPTGINFCTRGRYNFLHYWVLEQNQIEVPMGHVLYHVDGDVTNTMRENLVIMTRSQAMRLSMDRYWNLASITHCPHGHAYTEENSFFVRGHRRCKACNREKSMAYYYRTRGEHHEQKR